MRNFQSEEHLCLYRQQAFNFLVLYSPMIFKREEFYSYSLYVIWRTTPNHTFNSQSTIPMMMLGPRITFSILFLFWECMMQLHMVEIFLCWREGDFSLGSWISENISPLPLWIKLWPTRRRRATKKECLWKFHYF